MGATKKKYSESTLGRQSGADRGDRKMRKWAGGGKFRGLGPLGPGSRSTTRSPTASGNPFDAVGNRKAKFTVLNKRAKGQVRNVGKARQMAVERRKKTLLVEYRASKKDNVFKDRRFGEDDPTLSLEEKMLLRFQKERQKRARRSGAGRFNLEQEEENEDDNYGGLTLTHKGKALTAEDDYQDKDGVASSDDEDKKRGLNKEIVKELHFGGTRIGDRKRPLPGDEEGHYGPSAAKKSRAELMEEIIAKSKMHKAAKAKLKDAQELVLSQLDESFKDLVGDLEFRDKFKSKREEQAKTSRGGDLATSGLLLADNQDYDELVTAIRGESFAAKARDRTKTPEEEAREEREKLERLEAARRARMRGEVDAEVDSEVEIGGSSGEDAEARSGEGGESEEEEKEEGEEDLKGLGTGWDTDSWSDEEATSARLSCEDESHEEKSDSSEGEERAGSGSALKDVKARRREAGHGKRLGETERQNGKESGAPPVGNVRPVHKNARLRGVVAKAVAEVAEEGKGVNPRMPYVLECPSSLEGFSLLVREHARGPQDVAELITRIRRYHAIRSGGDRARVHAFYDVLMRRLACLGDALTAAGEVEVNAIAEALTLMAEEMPSAAAGLWGRMLTGLQARLGKGLRDHELGERARSPWPSPGALLLLRLLPRVFCATDFRHPVVTPALLYMGQALTQCPLLRPRDVERGLFVAALALQYTEESGRLMPEFFAFLQSLLAALAGESSALCLPTLGPSLAEMLHKQTVAALQEDAKTPAGPAVLGGWGRRRGNEEQDLDGTEAGPEEQEVGPSLLAVQCLSMTCHLIKRVCEGPLSRSPAAVELFQPLVECLAAVEAAVPKDKEAPAKCLLASVVRETAQRLEGAVAAARGSRAPLIWRKKNVEAIPSLAPRIIDNFIVRRDEGLEREAARIKQLTRQVKREKKGVMRELRRDAAFLDAEKVRLERERETVRRQVVKDNTAWLEASAADFNKQVKQAKGETLRGGGSGLKQMLLGKRK